MPKKILVVDDEAAITNTVATYLKQGGFEVLVAADGPSALKIAHAFKPNLIVLDLMLPGIDGYEVLQRLRRESAVYVLMLTAKAQETDKIIGLTAGADAYMTKPFSPRELVAQVKAVLRRERDSMHTDDLLEFQHIRIEPQSHRAWKDGAELNLTSIEFDLLFALARHRGRVFSREQLIEQIWGNDFYGDERVVDVHLGHLRKKIGDEPSASGLIVTVRGAGYRFEDEAV